MSAWNSPDIGLDMLDHSDQWVIVGKVSASFRTVVMTSVQEYAAGMSHFGNDFLRY